MLKSKVLTARDLAALAKRFRRGANKSRAQAARDMRVSQTSIFHAEESPEQSLSRLRGRMIEAYSPFRVIEGLFILERKRKKAKERKSGRVNAGRNDARDHRQ